MDTYNRSIRGLKSRSNGEYFERMIIAASRFYEDRGIAVIDKTPEASPLPEPLKIGFDSKLVLETLKAFTCENIAMNFSGPKMPAVVEAEDSDMKAIVLPVMIREE